MLALLGLAAIVLMLVSILTRRLSPIVALITFPVLASLAGGFGEKTAIFIGHGIQNVAPVAAMFVFAILYFGVMTDAGMLDPIIDRILRVVGLSPPRIVAGTALLALLAHLDGSGAVTFLVTIPVMLPLFDRLKMDRRVLACAAALAAGVNFLPWTGPMIRASAALHIPVTAIFDPLAPVQLVGLVYVCEVTWWMGKREAKRLGLDQKAKSAEVFTRHLTEEETQLRRPRLFWFNLSLTITMIVAMVGLRLEPATVFMCGTVLALTVNYPNLKQQAERIDAHEVERVAAMILGINLLLVAVVVSTMWRYAVDHQLVRPDARDEEVQVLTRRLTPSMAGYVAVILIGYFFPLVAVFGYLLIALLLMVPLGLDRYDDLEEPAT